MSGSSVQRSQPSPQARAEAALCCVRGSVDWSGDVVWLKIRKTDSSSCLPRGAGGMLCVFVLSETNYLLSNLLLIIARSKGRQQQDSRWIVKIRGGIDSKGWLWLQPFQLPLKSAAQNMNQIQTWWKWYGACCLPARTNRGMLTSQTGPLNQSTKPKTPFYSMVILLFCLKCTQTIHPSNCFQLTAEALNNSVKRDHKNQVLWLWIHRNHILLR